VQFTVPADLKDMHREVFNKDLATHTYDGNWDLPIPATFVIDRSGIVRAPWVAVDYMTRLDPHDIEAALAALN
jgi:peroxiredoxin